MKSRWPAHRIRIATKLSPFLYGLGIGILIGLTVAVKSNGALLKEARAQLLAMGCGEPYEPATIYIGKTPPSTPPPRAR